MSRLRHEYKYIINSFEKVKLDIMASALLNKDSHAGADGFYEIRSLYFDDFDDSSYYENVNGVDPRSKYRIRYYNEDISYISLEKKTKIKGLTLKESCRISKDECELLIKGLEVLPSKEFTDEKNKLLCEMHENNLLPKVIVSYKRIPYIYEAGNVRITFDSDLTSSNEIEKFLTGDYSRRPVFALGESLLEVKWDEVLPYHLRECLSLEQLTWTAFSKYYMCRTMHL